ncbi:hypothetical protein FHX69_7046 [Prauserella muralis]|nr:hypothetical protein FHX69_7046 [Prauserella muralis]
MSRESDEPQTCGQPGACGQLRDQDAAALAVVLDVEEVDDEPESEDPEELEVVLDDESDFAELSSLLAEPFELAEELDDFLSERESVR